MKYLNLFFTPVLIFASLSINASPGYGQTTEEMDDYVAHLELPIELKISTDGKQINLHEARVQAARVIHSLFATPKVGFYGELTGPGYEVIQMLRMDEQPLMVRQINFGALTFTHAVNVGNEIYVSLRARIALGVGTRIQQDTFIEESKYQEFKSQHCPTCDTDKARKPSPNPSDSGKISLTIGKGKLWVNLDASYWRNSDAYHPYYDQGPMLYGSGVGGRGWEETRVSGRLRHQRAGVEVGYQIKRGKVAIGSVFVRGEIQKIQTSADMHGHRHKGNIKNDWFEDTNVELPGIDQQVGYFGAGVRLNLRALRVLF